MARVVGLLEKVGLKPEAAALSARTERRYEAARLYRPSDMSQSAAHFGR